MKPLPQSAKAAVRDRMAGAAVASLSFLAVAGPALAHPGHGGHASFAAGLQHPFSGLDHLTAMIAVGLWAALRGGRAVWAWPTTFVGAMLAGYALGLAFPGTALVQPAILASIVVLGGLIAADAKTPMGLGAALIAAFGAAHGWAHGAEAPAGSSSAYIAGFAAATVTLHLTGLALGVGIKRLGRSEAVRLVGLVTIALGLALAVAP